MTRLDNYLSHHKSQLSIACACLAVFEDAREALRRLPNWERGFHLFWLMGPFVLLLERSPADFWLSVLSLAFVLRSVYRRDGKWLNLFWVKAAFVFWFWCIISSAISSFPLYSVSEAVIWFRFPLFAMATAFWLATDKRLLFAMITLTAIGLFVMCGILLAEIIIVGQLGGRLSWPYGDKVPGGYLAKVGLPVLVVLAALAASVRGRFAFQLNLIVVFILGMCLMTGERVNFLIALCSSGLAALMWKPIFERCLALLITLFCFVSVLFICFPLSASRFTSKLISGVTDLDNSVWAHTLNGGWKIALENLGVGLGTANYRLIDPSYFEKFEWINAQPHPHNYYLQLLAETGIIGFVLGTVFLWSIIWTCFKQISLKKKNVLTATAWVVPFGIFWPFATSADFFGQWNNVFIWSAVALSLSSGSSLLPRTRA